MSPSLLYLRSSPFFQFADYDANSVPAVIIGVLLGPVAANFLDPERWGSATPGQEPTITLSVMRVMIGIQLWVRF